ncbi:MAG: uroporphyrinogen-III C-methyltransferase [Candidatus Bathyarchaeota archaeon]|nr:uroporphyrinogen-III C-methyltransferase [Candidatus Bathyarchaeota archaeon]
MARGKVFLVGAGPSDPKLLTLRALELLKSAELVVYDRLVSEEIMKFAPKSAEKIYVGKRSGKHVVPQDKITELLVEKALAGRDVVRLKGGDPFIFGRGGEEAQALTKNAVEFEVVPGISSSVAAPMYAGIPLTHRDYASSVAVVTGHQAGEGTRNIDWASIARAVDTVVVLMGVESLESIAGKLLEGGVDPDLPVALVEQGTTKNQRSVTGSLKTIAEQAKTQNVKPPAVIVIGKVVELGRELAWFKPTH